LKLEREQFRTCNLKEKPNTKELKVWFAHEKSLGLNLARLRISIRFGATKEAQAF